MLGGWFVCFLCYFGIVVADNKIFLSAFFFIKVQMKVSFERHHFYKRDNVLIRLL